MRLIDADKLLQEVRDDNLITGAAFAQIKQHINNAETVGSDCENCGKVKTCKHVLGHPGTFTRINCPLWRP